ncbi:MAG: PAS domain S-box protein, partial [Acidobacteriota bacterium]
MPEAVDPGRSALALEIIEAGEDGFVAFDEQFRVVYVNPTAARLLGLEQAELAGRFQWEVFPATLGTQLRRAMVERVAISLNHYYETERKWYEVRANPSRDGGLIVRFRDISEEITGRKRAEAALRESEEHLSLAIEGAGMATWDVDLRTGRAVWSRRHFELLGYDPAPDGQATLEMWRSHVHPQDLEQVMAAFERARSERGLYCPEHRILRADNGQTVWLSVFGRFLYDEAGQAIRFIGVFFDHTAFREAARFIEAGKLARPQASAPTEPLRSSGLDVIGAMPWGTHLCQFYATGQDLVETLVPYFREGLAANEFCMWITSAPLEVEQATAALRAAVPDLDDYLASGQMEILDYSQWYTKTGAFDADSVLQGWTDRLAAARRRGFEGLRLTGNTFWLERADWDDFTRYEAKINAVIGGQPMLALCTYSLEKCGLREILDVVANHQFALIKRAGRWEVIESAAPGQIELALRASQERLWLATWAAELGVFEWHVAADRAVWENPRMYEIFGRSQVEGPLSKAQFVEQAIHPDDVASFEAAMAEGMKPGRLFRAICRVRRANDGEWRWVELSGCFERTPDGVPLRLVGVAGDITDRKRAEDALRESEEDLNRAQAVAKTGSWRLDTRHNELRWSDETHRMFGIPKGTPLTYEVFLATVHPEDREYVDGKWTAAIHGEPYDIEHRIIVGGGVKWVRERAELEFDREGTLLGGFGTVQDITDRKRAEDALRRSENQLRLITDAVPALIAYIDDSFRYRRANRTYERWFGLSGEQEVGRHVSEVLGEAAWEKVRPYMERALGGEAVTFELELPHPSGGPRWVHAAYTPDRDESGRVLGFVVLVHDIGKAKRAEERIRHQNAVLEGISRIFRDALTCDTEEDLGRDCLAVAEEATQSEFGFIGVITPEGRLDDLASSGPGWEKIHG